MHSNEELIRELVREGALKNPRIADAFRAIDRARFVPETLRDKAYENYPLPIGEGQTISQPYTVAFMLELLNPKTGMRILDIGAGSGWQTALLAYIVGEGGKITAIERIPALCEFAKKNIEKYGFLSRKQVDFFCGDASVYLPAETYDAIVASAAAGKEIPDLWRKALKVGGKIVAPIAGSIWLFTKLAELKWEEKEFPGFAFVPLVRDGKPLLPLSQVKKRGAKKNFRNWKLLFFCFFIAIIASLGWEIYVRRPNYSNIKQIEIPKGTGLQDVAKILAREEVIRSQWLFLAYTFIRGHASRMQAGAYTFAPLPLRQIEQELIRGGSSVTIVIPEGWTAREIESLLVREKISNQERFRAYALGRNAAQFKEKFSFLADAPGDAGLEGFLFPDTYKTLKTAYPEEIIEDMLKNFGHKITPALREEIARREKTIYQMVTMASLIEKEVVSDEDRAVVSGILWKRLSLGIPLQVDATISYIKKQKGIALSLNGKISTADTKIESPYNTYKYAGLPKGPIGNPGLAAIFAAIYPKESPYLYYLSTPEGKTIFSRTLEEHNTAKAKYLR